LVPGAICRDRPLAERSSRLGAFDGVCTRSSSSRNLCGGSLNFGEGSSVGVGINVESDGERVLEGVLVIVWATAVGIPLSSGLCK